MLDDDVASASAQLPADQGSVSAVATRPASPPSAPTRQATRQAATEEEKSKLLLTLVLSTCIYIYMHWVAPLPSSRHHQDVRASSGSHKRSFATITGTTQYIYIHIYIYTHTYIYIYISC